VLKSLVPHPRLSVFVALVWLMLVDEASAGALVMAVVVGLLVPRATRSFWPDRPPLRSGARIAAYFAVVGWDIVVANFQVAAVVLFRRRAALRPAFVAVPLELRSPEAITTLAATITLTPGTVSCDLSSDGRVLLVHCLDAPDPKAAVAGIKRRYERRLMEIFP
jgi:multicomponent K+:H+ antiporter subunit E